MKVWVAGLAVIRFVAIGLVVWAHGRSLLPSNGLNPSWFAPAHWGIELFFALSGFLITGQLLAIARQVPALALSGSRKYFIKRFLRTIPAFWIASFIVIFFSLGWDINLNQWLSEIRFAGSFPFFEPSYHSFVPVAWSLAIEEISYISFGIVALYIASRRILAGDAKPILENFFVWCIVVSVGLRLFVIFSVPDYASPAFIKKSALLQIDALAFGALAKINAEKIKAFLSRKQWFWVSLLIASATLVGWFVRSAYVHPEFFVAADGLTQKLMLAAHSLAAYSISRIICVVVVIQMISFSVSHPLVGFVYKRLCLPASMHSYSTYLFHLTVLGCIFTFAPNGGSWQWFSIYLMSSFVIGAISYFIIEIPWINLRRKLTRLQ